MIINEIFLQEERLSIYIYHCFPILCAKWQTVATWGLIVFIVDVRRKLGFLLVCLWFSLVVRARRPCRHGKKWDHGSTAPIGFHPHSQNLPHFLCLYLLTDQLTQGSLWLIHVSVECSKHIVKLYEFQVYSYASNKLHYKIIILILDIVFLTGCHIKDDEEEEDFFIRLSVCFCT